MAHTQLEQIAATRRAEFEEVAVRRRLCPGRGSSAGHTAARGRAGVRWWRWRAGEALALAGARLAGVDRRSVSDSWRRA